MEPQEVSDKPRMQNADKRWERSGTNKVRNRRLGTAKLLAVTGLQPVTRGCSLPTLSNFPYTLLLLLLTLLYFTIKRSGTEGTERLGAMPPLALGVFPTS